jgi:hypothetical protein
VLDAQTPEQELSTSKVDQEAFMALSLIENFAMDLVIKTMRSTGTPSRDAEAIKNYASSLRRVLRAKRTIEATRRAFS